MSWLSIPLPNPFKSQESDEENSPGKEEEDSEEESSSNVGVKEDLSELGKTIGRQLWGMASFLAHPPVSASSSDAVDSSSSSPSPSSQAFVGIRNDFAEIRGSFKSGLSLLSNNMAVSEISRLASNLLQFQEEDEEEEGDGDDSSGKNHGGGDGIAGVTDEVSVFVQEMSMRPEFWLDFPMIMDDDFDMSDAQREHASAVECFIPSLAALRVRLCPSNMNEGQFWMIYFIMLYPKMNENERKLLLTPQIVEARDRLLQELQMRKNKQLECPKTDDSPSLEVSNSTGHNIQEGNSSVQEKDVLSATVNADHQVDIDEQENIEKWLEEESNGTDTCFDAKKHLGNEEDVSFSDLEDDDDNDAFRREQHSNSAAEVVGASSTNESNEWVQLNESSDTRGGKKNSVQSPLQEKDSEGESSDWLTVDDFD
ncbi:PREDICTED: uncharacterized protein LOC104586137 [Nelumbo nucifera]|uniref:Uncharacterized protein LOC104586137 n=1 Tax=Nelumbo nucifera TaxID=4432 RepID=A0A1U7YUR3_NELNU|nr:PREDICTED: uncharacterized protein LOC104586137 [Nelumbo nucifera]